MKKQRRAISDDVRREVFSRTRGACYYCGAFATQLDHFVPYSFVANDTANNLVPACEICNAIAHNKHFRTRAEKKKYILEQRDTLKWRRRLARMEVTLIEVDEFGQPVGIVQSASAAPPPIPVPIVSKPAPTKRREPTGVYEATPPHRNPFKNAPWTPPVKVKSPPIAYSEPLPELVYHKPKLKQVPALYVRAQIVVRAYVTALDRDGIVFESMRVCLFTRCQTKTIRAAAEDRRIAPEQIYRMYADIVEKSERASWLMGCRPWNARSVLLEGGNKLVTP